ncbi:response regulator [Anaeromyxobacter oryzisoli]|uniref:response regulator n=1 Tax=Anaeromyxobacter oryzisoli TaxID=2925408 RepID=UPI001F57D3E1|nr:response regulator [Anaeromyxobacter sp. SG63]
MSDGTRTAPRILVVDDNAALRENLAECLELEGYPVSMAGDAPTALRLLDDEPPPGVVLLDLLMPGMDGRALAAAIRGNPRLANVRLVLTTGHPNARLREDVPADAILLKPFGVKELLAAISSVLA